MSLSPKFSKVFSKDFDILPPILYHYCPMSSFVEIIKSRQLWLTNFRCLNDPTDGIWIVDIIAAAADQLESKIDSSEETTKRYDEFIHLYRKHAYEAYIACFSTQGDLLSQWRAYGSDGEGVAIGFELGKFSIPARVPDVSIKDEEATGVFNITYSKTDQLSEIVDLIDNYITKTEEQVGTLQTVKQLKKIACVVKNPYFAEENEWRIIYRPALLYQPNGEIRNENDRDLQFRCGGNRVVPYFAYDMPDRDDLIREVILGPRNNNPPGMINMLLSSYGHLNVKIRKSPIPYR